MVDRLNEWLINNLWAIFVVIMAALVGAVWWASRLDERLIILEARPSSYDEQILSRLAVVETNQQNVIHRLDRIEQLLNAPARK